MSLAARQPFRLLPICAVFLLLIGGAASRAEEEPIASRPDLSGEWIFDVLTSPNGPGQRDALFRQDGERVIGFIESNTASGGFVGRFDGKHLEFTSVLDFGGLPFAGVYVATVEGDTMEGTIDYGEYGVATFVGRRKSTATESAPSGPVEIVGAATETDIEAARDGPNFGVVVNGVLTPELVAVAGGTFMMGSDADGAWEDQRHVHEVELSGFRLGRFEVTNAQYLAFVRASGSAAPSEPKGWTSYVVTYPNHPAVNVSWEDADAYVNWLSQATGESFRLPTEAEWEYAALAGHDGRIYVWGDAWRNDAANTSSWRAGRTLDRESWKTWWEAEGEALSKSDVMTTRVGSFPPNDRGLYDMSGNVWEWVHDWYRKDYYEVSPLRDPKGPESGREKVLRGASWYNKPDVSAIAVRDRYTPDLRLNYNGFRVAAPR